MKIATWNINGIKARLDNVRTWLEEAQPDVVCLQEIKSVDENFPSEMFEELGYNVETHGQKSFNGVALLSKIPLEDVRRGLPGDDSDEQARVVVRPHAALTAARAGWRPLGMPGSSHVQRRRALLSEFDLTSQPAHNDPADRVSLSTDCLLDRVPRSATPFATC